MIQAGLEPEHLAVNFKQKKWGIFISYQMIWQSISHSINVQLLLGLIAHTALST